MKRHPPPSDQSALVVDDEPVARRGLATLIEEIPYLALCGEASDTRAGFSLYREKRPDLVILDIVIGGDRGIDFIERVAEEGGGVILVHSRREETIYAEHCLRAGAAGYVSKRESLATLRQAMEDVLRGEISLSPRVSRAVLSRLFKPNLAVDRSSIETLTPRELEVLDLLGQGLSTQEIAGELVLGAKTIQTHSQNIRRKLGLLTHNQLIRRATQWVLEGR